MRYTSKIDILLMTCHGRTTLAPTSCHAVGTNLNILTVALILQFTNSLTASYSIHTVLLSHLQAENETEKYNAYL